MHSGAFWCLVQRCYLFLSHPSAEKQLVTKVFPKEKKLKRPKRAERVPADHDQQHWFPQCTKSCTNNNSILFRHVETTSEAPQSNGCTSLAK